MMLLVSMLILWTAMAAGAALAVWRYVATHRKVYGLIVIHGLYCAGIFYLYTRWMGP